MLYELMYILLKIRKDSGSIFCMSENSLYHGSEEVIKVNVCIL